MSHRKPWSKKQDEALVLLRKELKLNKWSDISHKLTEEFGIKGRSQKQCRERFHNHLDTTVRKRKLAPEQEIDFFEMHDHLGNKWSLMAANFPGVTDNYLKNTFHSRLRGAIRKINRLNKENIHQDLKTYSVKLIYKIIQMCQGHKQELDEHLERRQFCQRLKNKLIQFVGGKTIHNLLKDLTEKQMFRELVADLEYFENQLAPKKTEKSSTNVQSLSHEENSEEVPMILEEQLQKRNSKSGLPVINQIQTASRGEGPESTTQIAMQGAYDSVETLSKNMHGDHGPLVQTLQKRNYSENIDEFLNLESSESSGQSEQQNILYSAFGSEEPIERLPEILNSSANRNYLGSIQSPYASAGMEQDWLQELCFIEEHPPQTFQ